MGIFMFYERASNSAILNILSTIAGDQAKSKEGNNKKTVHLLDNA